VKKSAIVNEAKRKQDAGEELTDEEAKAVEEADKADPLALVTPAAVAPPVSATSETKPSDAV
jgi:hypothetical protein